MPAGEKEYPSTFYFPPRTNVHYPGAPEGFLSLEERIKQSLILYDHVVFESGLYMARTGPEGSFDSHVPASMRTAQRRRSASEYRSEEGFAIWIRPEGPGSAPRLLSSSQTEHSFSAEFDPLVDQLATQFGIEGVEASDIHITDKGKRRASRLAKEYLKQAAAVVPDGGQFTQRRIVQNLFRTY